MDNSELQMRYLDAIRNPEWSSREFSKKFNDTTFGEFLEQLILSGKYREFEKMMLLQQPPMSEELRKLIVSKLIEEYKLEIEADDFHSYFAIEHCIQAEALGLPVEILVERSQELNDYLSKNGIEKNGKYSCLGLFITALKASLVKDEVNSLHSRAKQVREMSAQEWNSYRAGIRWLQDARADDLERKAEGLLNSLFASLRFIQYGISEEKTLQILEEMPCVKEMKYKYVVTELDITYSRLGMRRNSTLLDVMDLNPRPPLSIKIRRI